MSPQLVTHAAKRGPSRLLRLFLRRSAQQAAQRLALVRDVEPQRLRRVLHPRAALRVAALQRQRVAGSVSARMHRLHAVWEGRTRAQACSVMVVQSQSARASASRPGAFAAGASPKKWMSGASSCASKRRGAPQRPHGGAGARRADGHSASPPKPYLRRSASRHARQHRHNACRQVIRNTAQYK